MAWAATCHAGQVLYGITQGDQLITFNTLTGVGTPVGALTTSMSAIGLAQTGGSLYAFDNNGGNVLRQLDPATAATLATIALNYTSSDVLGEGDLAFNNAGTGFVVSSFLANGDFGGGSFFSLNLAGNSHALVQDNLAQLFSGLAFNPLNDNLYAMTLDGSAIYLVNQVTGDATLVGSTGISSPAAIWGGLSFRADGALFASVGDNNSNSALYSVDTSTGAATLIGDTGFGAVSGLAFLGAADTNPPPGVPEPSTAWLMLALPMALAAGKRLRVGRQNHE